MAAKPRSEELETVGHVTSVEDNNGSAGAGAQFAFS